MDLRRTSDALTLEQKLAVVSLDEVKAQARVMHSAEDGLIEAMVEAAYDHLSGENGWLGRCCLLTETFQVFSPGAEPLSAFDRSAGFELPMRPFVSLDAFEWLQDDGSYAAVQAPLYSLSSSGGVTTLRRGSSSWPYRGAASCAYRATFKAGFGSDRASIPSPIRMAIKMLAATLYANRETVAERLAPEVIYGLQALAGRYRIEPDHS